MLGPVILDLKDKALSEEEIEILAHPKVAGVILFSRNYDSPSQLIDLCYHIRKSRSLPLLITVDQEGGRVQRFREGFSALPALAKIGQLHQNKPEEALKLAETCGWLIAAELLSVGVDLSFAPVLDLNTGSPAIGDRAFHSDPAIVTKLAQAIIKGMHEVGMASTGKHFPGHGSVTTDSHLTLPIDNREWKEVANQDLLPFKNLIQSGIRAMMPAHIVFSKMDDKAVGFSPFWLQTILRKQLEFNGVIFSDDLNMEGASFAGNYTERAQAALEAGCDMVLICNNRQGAIEILDHLPNDYVLDETKFKSLLGKQHFNYQSLRNTSLWKQQNERLKGYL